MFDFIPKPQEKRTQLIIIVTALVALVLVLYYFLSPLDLLPDSLGLTGLLDDAIVALLAIFFVYQVYKRLTGRWSANKAKYKELWRKGAITELLTSMKFWGAILIIGLAVMYWLWSTDIIPDYIVGLGWVDDTFVAIAAFMGIIKLYYGKNKK